MTLHQTIKDQVKEAMLAKDSVRLNTLRGLLSAFTNELVAKKRKPQEELTDEESIDVIRKSVKQRKDSIDQFKKGKREDLVLSEQAELSILETYLPQLMSKDDIRTVAVKKKDEMGITDKAKAGMLMGTVMKELKGQADGQDVKEVVESLFS